MTKTDIAVTAAALAVFVALGAWIALAMTT
jgi:hypothetical protein